MWVSPHSSQDKDSFTPGIHTWHYQHEGHIAPGLLCLSPGPCLGEGDKLCQCHHPHLELHYHWTEIEQTPLGFCGCFPQTDVCGKQWELQHGSLQWKKNDQLASKKQYPNAWGRHWLWCLHVLPQLLGWSAHESAQMKVKPPGWLNFYPTAQLKWHDGNQKLA